MRAMMMNNEFTDWYQQLKNGFFRTYIVTL